jgi:hypothetical protein
LSGHSGLYLVGCAHHTPPSLRRHNLII